ncbi:MAG: c-type cytochrome, partial [Rhodocyclaceae bacterium]|nr:c-type cytochrome [Rhodocyclaceae bacterium]
MPRTLHFLLRSILSLATLALTFTVQAADTAKPTVYQGDAARGQPIAATVCAACHGPDGNSPLSANPKLAGQHAAYLFRQMQNFKANAG